MLNMKTLTTAALAFASLSSAHLKLLRPVPYGLANLNRSPLADVAPGSAGSDYPCKLRPGVYSMDYMNKMTVGEPQELAFIGSVSHGGGTCQLAITKDKEPTASSVFKVFQVFEGGCPINSDGNTGTHPFTFVLPKDMPNGVMTFAWIWYNRIGNRELYMNCAPVTVSGGSDDDTYFNSLPNAYIINLPTTECQTSDGGASNAVTIPHPGQYILRQTNGQEMHDATGPNCAAKAAAMLDGVVGYKSNVESNGAAYVGVQGNLPPVPSMSAGAAGLAPNPGPTSAAAGGSGGGSAAPASPSAPPPAPSGGASAAPSAPAPAPSGGAPAPSGIAPPSGAPSGTGVAPSAPAPAPSGAAPAPAPSGGSCSSADVGIKCSSDGSQFGVCDNGKMVWRAVAPGTACRDGQIGFAVAQKAKRAEVFGDAALKRHLDLMHRAGFEI